MSGTEEGPSMTPIVNGVLCYTATARHSMRCDDMVRVCHSFYNEEDITKAKDILFYLIGEPPKVIPKRRRGKDRLIRDLEDIIELLKICDDGNITLPKFVVDNYNGLPPTSGFEFIADYLSKLNDELATLRKEVEFLKDSRVEHSVTTHDTVIMKEDLLTIKAEVRKLNHRLMTDNLRRDSLMLEGITKVNGDDTHISNINPFQGDNCMPSAPIISSQDLLEVANQSVQDVGGSPSAPLYVDVVRANSSIIHPTVPKKSSGRSNGRYSMTRLINKDKNSNNSIHVDAHEDPVDVVDTDEDGFQRVQKNKRKPSGRVVGSKKSLGDGIMRSAPKLVDIYVGNVNLGVTEEIVAKYIKDETNVIIEKCTALNTRNPNYSSFKISVGLKDRETLLSSDVWPEGVICRKFRSPRSFHTQ